MRALHAILAVSQNPCPLATNPVEDVICIFIR